MKNIFDFFLCIWFVNKPEQVQTSKNKGCFLSVFYEGRFNKKFSWAGVIAGEGIAIEIQKIIFHKYSAIIQQKNLFRIPVNSV